MSTVIHIIAKRHPQFLHYATILVDSLIRYGVVNPAKIFVSLDKAYLAAPDENLAINESCVSLISKLVNVEFYPLNEIGKFRRCDSIFERFEDVETVIQMDADMVLTEECNFIDRMLWVAKVRFDDFRIANYRHAKLTNDQTFGQLFRSRSLDLGFPPFRPEDDEGKRKYNLLVKSAFRTTPEHVAEASDKIGWPYGGVHVISRKLYRSTHWPSFLLMSAFCACDESVVQMWRCGMEYGYGDGHVWIGQGSGGYTMPMRVSPTEMNLEVGSGPGLMHYAGDWYRHSPFEARQLIQNKLQSVIIAAGC